MDTRAKISKGGPFKSSGTKDHPQHSGSNQVETRRPQLNCTACGGRDHLRKDCREDVSAIDAGPDLMLQRCATLQHNQPQVQLYAYIVAVLTTLQVNVIVNQTTIERSQGQHQETLRIKDPG